MKTGNKMKKGIAVILGMVMVISIVTMRPVAARATEPQTAGSDLANDPTAGVENVDINVQAIATNETVYSVDVEWGTMTFKYVNTWDPGTHTNGGVWNVYDTGEGDVCDTAQEDANLITVTNHSNAGVYATFKYTPDISGTDYSSTTGGFSKLDTDSDTSFTATVGGVPDYITLTTADNVVGGTGTPTVGKVYFMPTGIGNTVATDGIADWTTIGKITVGIQTTQPV